jgi:hypothetical protein
MRREARDRFLAALDAAGKSLRGSGTQEGIDLIRRGLAKLTEIFDSAQTPELLAQGLDTMEISPELEEMMIQAVESGPLFLSWIVMQLHQSAKTSLPRLPNREPAVTGRAQVEMVQFINKLNFEDDVRLEDAKARAAKRFGCSVRTVERYWREKKKILANGPKYSFQELLKELKSAIESDVASDTTQPISVR